MEYPRQTDNITEISGETDITMEYHLPFLRAETFLVVPLFLLPLLFICPRVHAQCVSVFSGVLRYKSLVPLLCPPGGSTQIVCLFLASLTLKAVADACGWINTFISKELVDVLSKDVFEVPMQLMVGGVLVQGVERGATLVRSYCWASLDRGLKERIEVAAFKKIHDMSVRWHIFTGVGQVRRHLDGTSSCVGNLICQVAFNLVPTMVTLIVSVYYLWTTHSPFLPILLLFSTSSSHLLRCLSFSSRSSLRSNIDQHREASYQTIMDSINNFETVKIFNNQQHEVEKFVKMQIEQRKNTNKFEVSLDCVNIMQGIVTSLTLLGCSIQGASQLVDGKLTLGQFTVVSSMVYKVISPINNIAFTFTSIKDYLAKMEGLVEFLDTVPDINNKSGAMQLEYRKGRVELKEVVFEYKEGKKVLDGISVSVEGGTSLAVVGQSGCGKSTLARLLCRLYDVTSGAVLLDGQDIRDVDVSSLREVVTLVSQEVGLFSESVRYNVEYGRMGVATEEVERVVEAGQIGAVVRRMGGPEVKVGARGLAMSGGERQRLALARIMLRKPKVLILDEVTSAMDSITEIKVMQQVKEMARKTSATTIIVAHRLSTICDCDKILVLEDGKVVEEGDHAQLLSLGGTYSHMWTRQIK